MPVAAGTKFGPYVVEALLGSGGMGEVYRARDTRVDRQVALKTLSEGRKAGEANRARFEREARAIAGLSHPNICALYDLGSEDGRDYLVFELLEGQTLAAWLAGVRSDRAPTGGADVSAGTGKSTRMGTLLAYAIEIASALEEAHRRGIVHRDLKPANVMLTRSGTKLLDFGVAKLAHAESPTFTEAAPSREAPTEPLTGPTTGVGEVIGTLRYMAPEQISGGVVDARTDIFAFGTVLYEMLSGRHPFEGATRELLIQRILEADPLPIGRWRADIPPLLERVVAQCLAKHPDDRWQTASDLRRELAWIAARLGALDGSAEGTEKKEWPRSSRIVVAALSTLALASAGLLIRSVASWPGAPEVRRFELGTGPMAERALPMLSPDGRHLVFMGRDPGSGSRLWDRSMESGHMRALPGTEEAYLPFWSPDSRFVGFAARRKLFKLELSSDNPTVICDLPDSFAGGTWGSNGSIVFAVSSAGLLRVPDAGGVPTPVFPEGSELAVADARHKAPEFLPDGNQILFTDVTPSRAAKGLYLGALGGKRATYVSSSVSATHYAPPGFLLFARAGRLVAQRFDADKGATAGEPFDLVGEPILVTPGGFPGFSTSQDGTLVYREPLGALNQFVFFGRDGSLLSNFGDPGVNHNFDMTPDGDVLAVAARYPEASALSIWTLDRRRGQWSRLASGGDGETIDPIWSPDGKRVAYSVRRSQTSQVELRDLDGASVSVVYRSSAHVPIVEDWSKDGRFLALVLVPVAQRQGTRGALLDLTARPDTPPVLFGDGETSIDEIHFSPNGRWLLYDEIDGDASNVFASTMPPNGRRIQVSPRGGVQGRWRGDGREIFYLTPDGVMMAVDVGPGAELDLGTPHALFTTRLKPVGNSDQYAVTADGKRFLLLLPTRGPSDMVLHAISNWQALLSGRH